MTVFVIFMFGFTVAKHAVIGQNNAKTLLFVVEAVKQYTIAVNQKNKLASNTTARTKKIR